MMRCFALTCLTVAFIASVSGCGGKKSLRAKKTRPTEAAAIVPPSAPVAEGPAPAGAPVAIPVGTAGAGGAAGNGMAVVILMLPAADAVRAPGTAPRTYKLSLSANADTATIQVDGQPAVSAPVQRVFPEAAPTTRVPAAAALRALPAVSTLRAPAVAVPRSFAAPPLRNRPPVQRPAGPAEIASEGTMELGEARAPQSRRTAISTAMRPLPPPVINPNGAPIID